MESLYTKYRPQTFADVVGQTHVVTTLEHAVIEGRTSHAYLFCGPRGTGKTTMARLLAKALMCEQGEGHLPDGTCDQCRMIAAGEHPDVYELDAASRTGVDNVRDEIISRVSFAPVQAPYKMYIIDEVHMLTTAAFNALLKTLEEPPAHVVFVLCTTDPQKIPETILSRVQRFDFHPIGNADIQGRLAYICEREGFGYDPEALELVVRHARGGMRDAISELEQLSVSGGGSITVDVARDVLGEVSASTLERMSLAMANRDVPTLFAQVESLVEVGRDLLQFTRALAARLRDVYVVAAIGVSSGIVSASDDDLPAISREAKAFGSVDRVARALALLSDASTEMRVAPNQRLVLEVALTKIARPQAELTLDALADRVATLEKQIVALSVMEPRRTAEAPRGHEAIGGSGSEGAAATVRKARESAHAGTSKAQEAARASQTPTSASSERGARANEASADTAAAHEQAASSQDAAAHPQPRSDAARGGSTQAATMQASRQASAAWGDAQQAGAEQTAPDAARSTTAAPTTATQTQAYEAGASDGAPAQGAPQEGARGSSQAVTTQAFRQASAAWGDAQQVEAAQTMQNAARSTTAAPAATQTQAYEAGISNGAPAQGAPQEGARGSSQAAAMQASRQAGASWGDAQQVRAAQAEPDSTRPTTVAPAAAQAAYGQAPQQQAVTEQPARDMSSAQSPAISDKGELQRRWKQVVDGLLATHPQHGSLLMNSSIVADDGYQLTVSFPKGSLFACRMLERPDVRANVDPMIEQVFGPRKARFAEGATAPAAQAAPAGAASRSAAASRSSATSASGGASARGSETPAQRNGSAQSASQAAAARPVGTPGVHSQQAASAHSSRTATAPRGVSATDSAQADARSQQAASISPSRTATMPRGVSATDSAQANASYRAPWEAETANAQPKAAHGQLQDATTAQPVSPYRAPWEADAVSPQSWQAAPIEAAGAAQQQRQTSQPAHAQAQSSYSAPWETAAALVQQEAPLATAWNPAPLDDDMVPYDDFDTSPYEEEFAFGDVPESLSQAAPAFGGRSTGTDPTTPAPGMSRAFDEAAPQQAVAGADPWAMGHAPAPAGSASAVPQSSAQGAPASQPSPISPQQAADLRSSQASAKPATTTQPTGTPGAHESPEAEATATPQPTGATQANAPGGTPTAPDGAPAAPATSAPAQQKAAPAPAKPRSSRRPAAAIPADIIAMMAEIFGEGVTYTSIAPDDQEDEVEEEPAGEDAAESEFVDEPVDDADYDEDE